MKNEMLAYLRGIFTPGLMSDEDFAASAEIAIYWFANDYHGGQAHPLYAVLSTSPYHPSPLCGGIAEEGDETAEEMYEDLTCVYNV